MMACRLSVSSLVIAAAAFVTLALNPFDDDEQIDVIGREVGLVNASEPGWYIGASGLVENTRWETICLLAAETAKVDRTTNLKLARAS